MPKLLINPLEAHFKPVNNAIIKKQHALILLGAGMTKSAAQLTPGLAYSRIVETARIYRLGINDGSHYLIFISGGATGKGSDD